MGKIGNGVEKQAYISSQTEKQKAHLEHLIKREIELILSGETPVKVLLEYCQHVAYDRAHENLLASGIFLDQSMSKFAFVTYLDLPKRDSDQIPPLITQDEPIPILINGESIDPSYSNLYLTKLSPSDPRCAVLGKDTGCCQHLDHEYGRQCAKHGISSPEGGFYVLCQKSKDKPASTTDLIVAQCWAWRSKSGNLVFDSIEIPPHYRDKLGRQITDFFTQWGHQLVTKYNISRVLVGVSGNTPETLGIFVPREVEYPVDYPEDGHRDSFKQRIVADGYLPFVDSYKKTIKHSKLSDMKEIKEKQERKRLAENVQIDKKAIFEWCELCAINRCKENLSYVERQAQFLGVSKAELEAHFSHAEKFLILLEKTTNFDEIAKFLDTGVSPSLRNNEGQTALMLAAKTKGQSKFVKYLLDKGAKAGVNDKDSLGNTALHLAVLAGDIASVSSLIEAGANVNEKNIEGISPLHLAVLRQKDLLPDPRIAGALLKAGAYVNEKDPLGNTALHNAATARNLEAIITLLQTRKIDVNTQNYSGETALHQAVMGADVDLRIIHNLLTAGVLIDARNNRGESVLHVAVKFGNIDTISLFLKAGVPIDLPVQSDRPDRRQTALELAIERSASLVVAFLIKEGASLDKLAEKRSILEETILHELAKFITDPEAISIVLERKKSLINEKNMFGETALHIAVKSKNLPMISALLAAGLSIYEKDKHGNTPFTRAKEGCASEKYYPHRRMGEQSFTAVMDLLNEVVEKDKKQQGEPKGVAPLVFSQQADAAFAEILKEAENFIDPTSRSGEKFNAFKGKLGLKDSDTIFLITKKGNIQLQDGTGRRHLYHIKDLYAKQIKASPSPKPPPW